MNCSNIFDLIKIIYFFKYSKITIELIYIMECISNINKNVQTVIMIGNFFKWHI